MKLSKQQEWVLETLLKKFGDKIPKDIAIEYLNQIKTDDRRPCLTINHLIRKQAISCENTIDNFWGKRKQLYLKIHQELSVYYLSRQTTIFEF